MCERAQRSCEKLALEVLGFNIYIREFVFNIREFVVWSYCLWFDKLCFVFEVLLLAFGSIMFLLDELLFVFRML